MTVSVYSWMEDQINEEYYDFLKKNMLIALPETEHLFWAEKLPEKIDNPFFDVL